ncbi:hypothetical protein EYC80_009028 [Monilinia laxa]|uniref:Uncharacterized protein n=1 Tax=Monilinia laxa TaxID=61186 RepID=A0A5N6K2J3_MONLA|nr:hypothetical protein EYC80_009028 [Monilinia laxa]
MRYTYTILPLSLSLSLTTLLPQTHATTSAKFSLLSKSTYATYNNIHFGSVGSVSGTLVAGLQPFQTLPIGGTITNGILSFIGADPSDDALPAYFIHGAAGTWVALDVWASPQSGYSLDASGNLLVDGAGAFYACLTNADSNSGVVGVFYTTASAGVPSGCYKYSVASCVL